MGDKLYVIIFRLILESVKRISVQYPSLSTLLVLFRTLDVTLFFLASEGAYEEPENPIFLLFFYSFFTATSTVGCPEAEGFLDRDEDLSSSTARSLVVLGKPIKGRKGLSQKENRMKRKFNRGNKDTHHGNGPRTCL